MDFQIKPVKKDLKLFGLISEALQAGTAAAEDQTAKDAPPEEDEE